MIDNLRAGRRETGRGQRADEKRVRSSSRRDSAALHHHHHHHQIRTGGRKYQSRTRTKKKGGSFHQKEVVKRLGVSIRGGVPVDMLSVPRLPLRLHSLAASRTGSKRFAREEDKEDAEADADADMVA